MLNSVILNLRFVRKVTVYFKYTLASNSQNNIYILHFINNLLYKSDLNDNEIIINTFISYNIKHKHILYEYCKYITPTSFRIDEN